MKVTKSDDNILEFDNGLVVEGDGEIDCCAVNYIDFEQFPVGAEFPTMNIGEFVDAITLKKDGFSVTSSDGVPKWAQARSDQNGYYSNITTLVVKGNRKKIKLGDLSGKIY